MTRKTCTGCGKRKPLDAFHAARWGKFGKNSRCKVCVHERDTTPEERQRRAAQARTLEAKAVRRAWAKSKNGRRYQTARWIRQKYGIEPEDLARLYHAQGRRCAACLEPLDLDHLTHIDHDHKTGKVRGLLCRGCNIALGAVRDQPTVLLALAHYLERGSA